MKKNASTLLPRVQDTLELIKGFNLINVNRYLDLGCNNSNVTIAVADGSNAAEVYGVDVDNNLLESSKRHRLKTVSADLNKDTLPFNDKYFDLITSFEVIEHLINPDNMLREANRVLRSGGLFVLSTPNLSSWLNRLYILAGAHPTYADISTEFSMDHMGRVGVPMGHLRLYTLPALKRLLEYHGFILKKAIGTTSTYQVPSPIRSIDKVSGKISPSLGRILIVACTKP